jgi:hypothetical protein
MATSSMRTREDLYAQNRGGRLAVTCSCNGPYESVEDPAATQSEFD